MYWINDVLISYKEGSMKLAIFDEAFILLRKPHHLEVTKFSVKIKVTEKE